MTSGTVPRSPSVFPGFPLFSPRVERAYDGARRGYAVPERTIPAREIGEMAARLRGAAAPRVLEIVRRGHLERDVEPASVAPGQGPLRA